MKKIILFVVLILMVIMLSSCLGGASGHLFWDITAAESNVIIPFDATNAVDKGNGWIQFDLDGNTYLFLYRKVGSGRAAAITQIK